MQHLDDRCANRIRSKVMCAELGHANIAMTLDLYSHVTADMQRHAADTLEASITGAEQRTA